MTLTVVFGQSVTLETVVTGPWGCLLGLTEEGYLGDVEIVEGGWVGECSDWLHQI